jgi:hypothetical protein
MIKALCDTPEPEGYAGLVLNIMPENPIGKDRI